MATTDIRSIVVNGQQRDPNVPWTIADAVELYGVDRWGQGYFAVNDKGHLVVQPYQMPDRQIDLMNLVEELMGRDLAPPLLIRFTDILKHRINHIHSAFAAAIRDNEYRGGYRAVYPIKVNQQRHVVEEILDFGRPYGMGLEAGSKPELLAIMAMVKDDDTPIICNGFKDDEFIEAVILAAKIGKKIIPVVEKFSELRLIAKYAKIHDVKPAIGVRTKLSSRGQGRWEQSGGYGSKFGLFSSEVVEALNFLRENGMEDCLKMIHFHIGSQVPSIGHIKAAVTELARMYVELQRAGAGLEYLDVGGGLGIDYDGSQRSRDSSMNYSLEEYASNIIFHVKRTCDQAGIEHPTIITEGGRALVAYHSVLIVNVLGWSGFDRFEVPDQLPPQRNGQAVPVPQPLISLFETYHGLNEENCHEYYHDAQLAWEETINLFSLGYCTLEQRALAERLYFGICSRVLNIVRKLDEIPEDYAKLERMLADTYFCNWSIFQSLPDSWAIDQIFPIVPIHRLNEEPTSKGILADITCDSDGCVDHFIADREPKKVLELHPYSGGDYYLAVCLVGAYQEILGDLHNLFGDTNAVHVSVDEEGNVSVDEVVEGDSVEEVLHYVQYSAEDLMRAMRKRIEQALRDKRLTLDESRLLLRFYESGLKGYTYLE